MKAEKGPNSVRDRYSVAAIASQEKILKGGYEPIEKNNFLISVENDISKLATLTENLNLIREKIFQKGGKQEHLDLVDGLVEMFTSRLEIWQDRKAVINKILDSYESNDGEVLVSPSDDRELEQLAQVIHSELYNKSSDGAHGFEKLYETAMQPVCMEYEINFVNPGLEVPSFIKRPQ